MSHFLKISFLSFLGLLLSIWALAQKPAREDFLKLADEAVRLEQYQTAYEYYGEALKFDSCDAAILTLQGITAFRFFAYDKALDCFLKSYQADTLHQIAETPFWLGETYRSLENYPQAFAFYSIFISESKTTSAEVAKAENILKSKKEILNALIENPSVKVEHLRSPVNTPYSEFGAIQAGNDSLLFSSVQPAFDPASDGFIPLTFVSEIYYSSMRAGGQSRPLVISELTSMRGTNTANPSLSSDGRMIVFTRCSKNRGINNCKILTGKLTGSGRFQNIRELPPIVNAPNTINTQGHLILEDSLNGILYFSSNREGGFGGMDIWYSVLKKGKYNQPVNLGSVINSKGNEITPFFDTQDSLLYFSSDFHPGLGAYDIFHSKGALSGWEKPLNAGKPFNSGANDFYFNINTVDRDGYFTSNRGGSYFIKGQTCCNDIFAYYRKQIQKKNPLDTLLISTTDSVPPLKSKIEKLFPLDLYFHNDIPDPRSHDSSTTVKYDDTYFAYLSMADTYVKEYNRGVPASERQKYRDEIERFFSNSVTDGFDKLMRLTPLMIEDLKSGSTVSITIKGFCSPLTSTEYNILLAKRRIQSLVNYFRIIDGGILQQFIDGTHPSGGKLAIVREPVGEALSDPFVSDNPNDSRNSVYSISAARERRIRIANYTSTFNNGRLASENKGILRIDRMEVHYKTGNLAMDTVSIKLSNDGKGPLTIREVRVSDARVRVTITSSTLPAESQSFVTCLIPAEVSLSTKLLVVFLETTDEEADGHVIYLFPEK